MLLSRLFSYKTAYVVLYYGLIFIIISLFSYMTYLLNFNLQFQSLYHPVTTVASLIEALYTVCTCQEYTALIAYTVLDFLVSTY